MEKLLMIANEFCLITGITGFSISYYIQRKQAFYHKLFQDLEKCPKYHLDYVEGVNNLPTNKNVILFGTVKSIDQEKIIIKSYLKKKNEPNRFWRFYLNKKFVLTSLGHGKIEVHSDHEIFAFNLLKLTESQTHQERVIHEDEPVCVYGLLTETPDSNRQMQAKLIMGTKQEQLLVHLDNEIVKFNQKRKNIIIASTIMFMIHICLKFWDKKTKKQIQKGQKELI